MFVSEERSFVVWIVALGACMLGLIPTAVLGLSVSGEVILPLAMGLGALFAAIAASWMSNFLIADDGSRSRLLPIVGVAEATAAAVAGVLLLLALLEALAFALIFLFFTSAAIIASSATAAARRLRAYEEGRPLRDAVISVSLVIFGLLVVFGGVWALCSTVVSCVP